MKPTIATINCETKETIIREMNDAEYAQHLINVEAEQARQAEAESSDNPSE